MLSTLNTAVRTERANMGDFVIHFSVFVNLLTCIYNPKSSFIILS